MNIEKFKLWERVRIAYLKHRGNIIEMQKDTGLDMELLRKMRKKLQRAGTFGKSIIIVDTIANYIMEGMESRIYYHMEMLRGLDNKDQVLMSVCCKMPVKHESVGDQVKYYCIKCKKEAEVMQVTDATALEAKRNVLSDIREEQRLLQEFVMGMRKLNTAEDIGRIVMEYINKEAMGRALPIVKEKEKEKEPDKGIPLTEENKEIMRQTALLPMPEKLKLLKALEIRIAEGEAKMKKAITENGEGDKP